MTFFILFYEHDRVVHADMGGFRKAWVLAEHLRALGHRVVVFGPAGSRPPDVEGVEAVEVPYVDLPVLRPLLVYLQLFWRPLLAARRGRPDVVYIRPLNSPLPILLARILGARLVVEVNGDSLALYEALGASWLRRAFVRWMERLNVLAADVVIPLTGGLERMLDTRHGVPPARVRVIESGSDTDLFRPLDGAACRHALGLDPSARYVGFVGSFLAHQGIDTLIAAAPHVLARCPAARFLLVGDGVMRSRWEERVAAAGLSDRFVFTGQVPYRDVPRYVAAMDVCVAPFSANRGETSPLKVFDSLACGKPVIASGIESILGLAEGCAALVTVPPEQPERLAGAIAPLLDDPEAARRLGATGRDWVLARHTWRAVAEDIVDACVAPVAARFPPPAAVEWPVVSVVIATWNRRRDVVATLEALARLDYPADRVEILVRDNASTDDTERAVRDWMGTAGTAFRRVEIFRGEENLGCAGGRNFAALRAEHDSDFLFMLDDDAVPDRGYIRRMIALAGRDPRIGVVGGAIRAFADPGTVLSSAGVIDWRLVRFKETRPSRTVDCDYVTGCAMFVRRDAFLAAGGFDEEYLAYHEDVDFCVRVKRRGFRILYEPDVAVYHKVPLGKVRTPFRLYFLFRNKLLFMHKHAPPRTHTLAWLLYRLAWPFVLLAHSALIHRGIDAAEFRMIRQGVADGFR
ncbi:MAG: glycosyltransferase, partial [Candidatus Rokubacteria bacterium]|nr:glycosyltransferase [Candidatus Rokubacteria bacterium]